MAHLGLILDTICNLSKRPSIIPDHSWVWLPNQNRNKITLTQCLFILFTSLKTGCTQNEELMRNLPETELPVGKNEGWGKLNCPSGTQPTLGLLFMLYLNEVKSAQRLSVQRNIFFSKSI